MEFRVLGLLEVVESDRRLPIRPGRESALLALLLANANQPLSVDRLVEELWNERRTPEHAAKAVQVTISRLRQRLGGERITTTPAGYLLSVGHGEIDASRFEQLAEEGRSLLASGDPGGAERVLSEALGLWRGEAFSDFRFDVFAQAEIGRLGELRRSTIADRIDARLALGRAEEHIAELQMLVGEHPLWERPRRQLMLALYQAGRQADALELYRSMRSLLAEELGLDPTPELQALERAILNQAPELERPRRTGAPGESETTTETAPVTRGAFVGRDWELAQLSAGLGDIVAGQGRLFLIVGEPGIGKSRLADELARTAAERGVRVLAGRCWEAGGAPAYWPWVQALRAYVREAGPEHLRAELGADAGVLAAILPELREEFPELPIPAAVDSEAARFRLFDSTSRFLRAISARRPTVLVLDDLHAADEPSLLLLRLLTRELGSMRLLVLAAYRDVDPVPGGPLTALLGEVVGEPVTRRLLLRGLNQEDVAEYLELTAAGIASSELTASLHAETEGNPLFLAEAVRLLESESRRAGSVGATVVIPQSVRDVIARRLTHLSEECNHLLALASVLGREFAPSVLARVSARSENEVLDTLDEAMVDRVVSDVPGGPGRLRFSHVLIRDTLYDRLTSIRRVRAHRLALEALEALYGDEPGQHLTELAHHAVAGSDFENGVLYARRAGDRALSLLAYEEAARLYATALDALELVSRPDERERCELFLSLGDAELRAGYGMASKRAFLEAARLARLVGLPRELARAATGYGGRIMYARAGDDDSLIPLLEESLAVLPEDEVELRALLLARLAGALRDEPSRHRRDRVSGEAVELARRAGNATALAYALDGRAAAIIAPDTLAECVALGSELCQVGERIGDNARRRHGHWHRITAELVLGEIGEAKRDLGAMRLIAEDLRQPTELWPVYAADAILAGATGRFTEAEAQTAKAYELGERAQPEIAIPVYLLQRYTLGELRGGLEEVESGLRQAAADYPARPMFRCALAHLDAQLGRAQEARHSLEELATDGFAALPFDLEWLYAMSLLAETAATLDDVEAADVLYPLLLPWATLNAADLPEGFRGPIARYLGLLAGVTGGWDASADHFESALRASRQMGLRPWLAHTQRDYARTLVKRGEPASQERAHDLLAAAAAAYDELGMQSHADELVEAGGRR